MDILTIVLTSGIVTAIINVGWQYFDNNKQFKNAKYMQISSYYRDKSGGDMHKILNDWTDMLMFSDDPKVQKKMQDTLKIKQLLKQTFLYSSPETCKRLSNYQSYNYKNVQDEPRNLHETLVLVAGIIVSLRHDFTGDWVSIEETLRLKLTDYDENKEEFNKVIEEYNYNKYK